MRQTATALALALTLLPGLTGAHPHIFVEAQVTLEMDGQGNLTGVRLAWLYDDFFSLMLTADLGIDPEGDMILTAPEQAVLTSAVLDWPADFGGDLFVTVNGQPVALAPRADPGVIFDAGRIAETHLRRLAVPLEVTGPLAVQVYDPFYYVAYSIVAPITLTGGAACTTTYQAADLNSAYALVDELLYGRAASDVGPDEAFPEVGQSFADTVVLTCGG